MELPGAANQEVDATHTHTPHTERFSDFLTSLMLDVDVLEKTSCGMIWLFASWITHTHRIARPPRDLAQGFRATDLSFLSLLSSFTQFLTSIGTGIK